MAPSGTRLEAPPPPPPSRLAYRLLLVFLEGLDLCHEVFDGAFLGVFVTKHDQAVVFVVVQLLDLLVFFVQLFVAPESAAIGTHPRQGTR